MMDSSIWIVAVVAAVVLILTVLLFCKAWLILRRNGHPSFLYSHRPTPSATPYGHSGPIGSSRGALTLPAQHLHLNLNSTTTTTTTRRPMQLTAVDPISAPDSGPAPHTVVDYSSVYSVHAHPQTTTTSQLRSGFLNLGYQEESALGTSITVELDESSSVPMTVSNPNTNPNACDYFEFDPPPSYRELFLSTRHPQEQPTSIQNSKASHNKKQSKGPFS